MEILAGQIWQEKDNRYIRRVKVLRVDGIWVHIQNTTTGRKTSASASRFSGKKGGYDLVEDTRES